MSKESGAGLAGPRRRFGKQRAVDPEALQAIAGRITALEEQKNPGRRSLFVDGEFVLGLDLETVLRCGLKKGLEVDGRTLWRAYQLDQEKAAWESGMRLLAASPRSVREVTRRLGRTYPSVTVEAVVGRLIAAGWLDDRSYSENYIRSHPDYGSRRLVADLVRKGVARELAATVVEVERGDVEVVGQARELAAKRLARMGDVDRISAQRRLSAFLARRGFGPEAIWQALEPLLSDLPQPKREWGTGLRQRSQNGWSRSTSRTQSPSESE